jgi:hypothetical protein
VVRAAKEKLIAEPGSEIEALCSAPGMLGCGRI